MVGVEQLELMPRFEGAALPQGYAPHPPERFLVERIILCKGSLDTPEREAFVLGICGVYPGVPVEERLGVPHNRVEFDEPDPERRVARGKRTLVFGELGLKSAVWENELRNAVFTNEMCFSVYGFCPYGCTYCYLNGTPGVWHSPTVKIYVNLAEIMEEIGHRANAARRTTTFYLGRYQDGLALDPLTGYSTALIPFFARHRFARQVVQTKSAEVRRLLDLDHERHTILSWTLTPPSIAERYEYRAPPVEARIEAVQTCAARGYPVQACVAPILPCGDWEETYVDFIHEIVGRVPLERLIISEVCMDPRSLEMLENRMGRDNAISRHLARRPREECDRAFYRTGLCDGLFSRITAELGVMRGASITDDRRHGLSLVVDFANR